MIAVMMSHKRFTTILAVGAISILLMLYLLSFAIAADMKVPPKKEDTTRSWICGYSAGFEDGIRKLDDPRQPEPEQCARFRAEAKKVVR